ncbi:MAG: alkaline phosphatase family protein [Actinomycetota bacterium]
MARPVVAMVVIDALPHRHVGPDTTPHLWSVAESGAFAPTGGRSTSVSVTYANHAALITGAPPAQTWVHGNHTWDGTSWAPAPKLGPRAATLFDHVAAMGGRSAFVAGDHKLVHQMGATTATHHWPPDGRIPAEAPRCIYGYAADVAVLGAATDLLADSPLPDLVVLHLNEPDTAAHHFGPDSADALGRYRATDAVFGEFVELLRQQWDDVVLIVVSDHDQEEITDQIEAHGGRAGVELAEALADLDDVNVAHEGTAALIHVDHDSNAGAVRARAAALDGVEGVETLDHDGPGSVLLAWTAPGRSFGTMPVDLRGQHGSPRCRTQVAVVGGGHSAAADLGKRIVEAPPSVLAWAPAIRTLLADG